MVELPFRSLIDQIFTEGFTQGNLAVVDKVLSPDHITHNPFGGREGLKWLIVSFRTAFPDLTCTVEDQINEGDRCAAHWTLNGTHLGPYLGNPPTGRQVKVQGLVFARTLNGQIVEDWTLVDQMGILQQLGIIPPLLKN